MLNRILPCATLIVLVSVFAGDKTPPPPMPPLKEAIRPRDGEYGPEKWTWDSVSNVVDPVTGETLFIGGRVGGVEKGHIGHWALSADGKSWRELTGTSAVLDPMKELALAARAPAKLGQATARRTFYAALDAEKEAASVTDEPARLIADALKRAENLRDALDAAHPSEQEIESIARAKVKVAQALGGLGAARDGFALGKLDAALLRNCFEAQWALDEAVDCLASEPGPREAAAVGVDLESKRVIVFGGNHGDYALSDTWLYDCAAKTWRQLWPTRAPSARFRAELAWDAETKSLRLKGGQAILNKMEYQKGEMPVPAGEWRFDLQKLDWIGDGGVEPGTRIYRTIVPAYNPLAFDAAPRGERRVVDEFIKQMPANTWVKIPAQPVAAAERDWGNAIFDPESDCIYRWTGGHCADPSNGMSTYHLAINRWSQPFVPEILLGRKGMSFNGRPDCANHTYLHCGYDTVSKRMVCVAMGGTGIFNPEIGDFEATIAHPFNRYIYETCSIGTPHGFVVWTRNYFGTLDVKAREWKKLPVSGKLPGPQCDGSCLCYDLSRDALWLTSFLGYQKPSGNIWRYDMKQGVVTALDPANSEICKIKGFNSEIRESVYIPGADIVLYNNFVNGKEVAYDCAKNAWVLLNIQGKQERQGTVSDTLIFDAKRGVVWDLNSYKTIYAMKVDAGTLERSAQ